MITSESPFIPHTLAHLTEKRVFPNPLPEAAYAKMLADYAALTDVTVSDIRYQSDGFSVTGLSALPKKPVPKSHPLLIYNRGGSGEYGKLTVINVLRSMAPFAEQGYLVFASNYRGNAGGEGKDEFGGDDVNDVLNLLGIAQSNPHWDGKNAFMLGHSRGGMMAYMAIKKGAKLNAAISLAGIADTNDIAKTIEPVLKARIPGYAENPLAALSERCAIDWPEKITVPLLLIHGDNDKDVPVSHSIRLAGMLAQPHRLHIVEGGNHSLYRHWDEVLALCNDWLKTYSV